MNASAAGLPETYRLAQFDTLGSTNDEAMACARAGDAGKLWIVADSQTGGRGRQARQWISPPGNLYASLLLIDPAPPAKAAQLGFVAGVALAQSVRGLLGGDAQLALKWPNELVHAGAKLSGMLLEASLLPDGRFACVIGCGVNCRSNPEGLPYPTTNLSALGSPCGPRDVLSALATRLEHWLQVWQAGAGFEKVRAAWLREALAPGSPLRVVVRGQDVLGHFETIDAEGRLILATANGPVSVEAGDVFLQ